MHPELRERISAIKDQIPRKTAADQRSAVTEFVEEYDAILTGVASIIIDAIKSAAGAS
jgi:hypothetical protein